MSGAGQVAIVTGGSGGIGRETVMRLAARGCDVVASYCSSGKEALSLLDESKNLPGKVVVMKAEVAEAGDVEALFDKAEESFGGGWRRDKASEGDDPHNQSFAHHAACGCDCGSRDCARAVAHGLSRSSLYRKVAEGSFPCQIKIG